MLIPFLYSATIFYILKYIVGVKFALIVTFLNFYTNFFDGYALPNMKLINHINKQLNVNIKISMVFKYSTIEQLLLSMADIFEKDIVYLCD